MRGEIGIGCEAQFPADVRTVPFDGASRGAKDVGDLLGGEIELHKGADLQLCRRQIGKACGKPAQEPLMDLLELFLEGTPLLLHINAPLNFSDQCSEPRPC